MEIQLISIGDQMPMWVKQGFLDYQKRLPKHLKLSLVEIARPKQLKTQTPIAQQKALEAQAFLKKLSKDQYVIALDPKGCNLTTHALAEKMNDWQMSGKKPAILIGGSHGLGAELLDRANERWSLSKMIFPHMMVRVIIAEQLYRAWSINTGHPYHK